jgi:hypothetical protein
MVQWTRENGQRLSASATQSIEIEKENQATMTQDSPPNGHEYFYCHVTSKLYIESIQKEDFGIYYCSLHDYVPIIRYDLKKRVSQFKRQLYLLWTFLDRLNTQQLALGRIRREMERREVKKLLKEPFVLILPSSKSSFVLSSFREMQKNVKELSDRKITQFDLPVGAIVTLIPSFVWPHDLGEAQYGLHIPTAELFVNNVSVHSLNVSARSCKLMTIYDFTFFPTSLRKFYSSELSPFVQFPLRRTTRQVLWQSKGFPLQPEFTFCMSPETYGVWIIKFTNIYTNYTSNKTEVSIVDYPETYVIKPRRPSLVADILISILPESLEMYIVYLFSFQEEDLFYDFYKAKTYLNTTPSDSELALIAKLAQAEGRSCLFQENLFLFVAFFVVGITVWFLFVSIVFFLGVVGYTSKWVFFRAERAEHAEEAVYPHVACRETGYDVYVCACEEDRERVERDIVSPSETEWKLRVFFPLRDIAPGQPELAVSDRAMTTSSQFIVVVSEHLLLDIDVMFEAERIVCVAGRERVLAVVLDFVRLPPRLAQLTVHDWTAFGLQQDHLKRQLYRWLFNVGFVNYMYLATPLLRACRLRFARFWRQPDGNAEQIQQQEQQQQHQQRRQEQQQQRRRRRR